jgi:hypothetical protein
MMSAPYPRTRPWVKRSAAGNLVRLGANQIANGRPTPQRRGYRPGWNGFSP